LENNPLSVFKIINQLFLFVLLSITISCSTIDEINYRNKSINESFYDIPYGSGNWEHPNYKEAFSFHGNHRVVVELDNVSNEIHQVIIPWRRRDDLPHNKDVIIVNAANGYEITDKYFIDINNDFGHILFKPQISSKRYFFYYLPHNSTGGYYPKVNYISPKKDEINKSGKEMNDLLVNLSSAKKARVIKFESIDGFNSFFPMEIISSEDELDRFFSKKNKEYYLFPEYRDYPIKMMDFLPLRWVREETEVNGLLDEVSKGEYYTFQVGLFSPFSEIKDVELEFTDLISKSNIKISKDNFTCFNKEGVDLYGKLLNKKISIDKSQVQSLWFGLQIPKNARKDSYNSHIIIKPSGMEQDTVHLKLDVNNKLVDDFGDNNPEKMTRLRWLNSKIGSEKDIIISPFEEVKVKNDLIKILGREIKLNTFGLPENILSFFSQEMTYLSRDPIEILSKPMSFDLKLRNKKFENFINEKFEISQSSPAQSEWISSNSSENFRMDVSGLIEYDGMMDLKIQLISKNDNEIDDTSFKLFFERYASKYMLGLGRKGGSLNNNIDWKWDVTKHQEGLWLGNINGGLQYVLRDNNYERPLNTNFYQSKPLNLPESWYNDSKGGISVDLREEEVIINNFSGERFMKKGDTLDFNIRFLITPFKLINTEDHFNTRFVHKYIPVDSVVELNGTIVNVHHANEINPYINYPFYNIDKQREYINEAHQKGIKVKLYNTIRELTYKAYELFPLRSLGDEIFNSGKGGGHSWLQEHLKRDYHSAWHAVNVNDASILNKGTSRWTNYYIEGINWLAKNNDIDGLYLDDIAFSRSTVKRIASVLNRNRESFVIDLHSANQYNNRDGFINSALLYMEHFPFVSRLWFGEYFDYNLDPDYWMTEVSGIPFGLTGEMLEKGGRPYHGLVYGMTTRVYHNYNPGNIWKIFKDFNIQKSRMIGYWVDNSPIKIHNEEIRCTIYQKEKEVLITIASWSGKDELVELDINWDKIGFNKSEVRLVSPEVSALQEFKIYKTDDKIKIKGNKGLVLKLTSN